MRAIVLDGASSRDASHIAKDLFDASSEKLTAREVLSGINQRLGHFALNGGASTGTIIEIASNRTIDVAHVTDSWAMALLRNEARYDPRVREALTSMFNAVRNTPDGSGEGILNGSQHMDQYIHMLPQPLNVTDVAMILVGSDGARFPHETEKDPLYHEGFFSL